MNYAHLFADLQHCRIRVALAGANGGFGRTFLAQCRAVPCVELAALCDRDIEGLRGTLVSMGWRDEQLARCDTAADVRAAAGRIALVAHASLISMAPHDIVVEATGQPEPSVTIALDAIARGAHVGMVTKETDSVVGPYLNRLARENGVVYTTVDGDQPANLIGLVTWARVLGFDVVAAGKSSEYDFVHHPGSGEVSHRSARRAVPALAALWHAGADIPETLARRREALREFPQCATPDYCEMNVVANSTGLVPACDTLSYPLCRIAELADVFVPRQEGGVLERTGVVDVFHCLRRDDEASFGGGVFVIVRCTHDETWKVLEEKGHVVGRGRKYACIYKPFHLMGLESLTSLYSAVIHGRPSGSAGQDSHAVMVARAVRAFRAGEHLGMGGHFHDIEGVAPRLLPSADAQGLAPYYLAADKRLKVDLPAGADVRVDMLEVGGSALHAAWQRMQS